jgi:hypothetical protein
MNFVPATVVRGHGVASGASADPRFPEGTIRLQLPLFQQRGLDVEEYIGPGLVVGTLNLSLEPRVYEIGRPEFSFPGIAWTSHFPAENFYLSPARVHFRGRGHRALLYIPDPATKPDHVQPPGVIEVLAERVAGALPGSRVELEYDPAAILVR